MKTDNITDVDKLKHLAYHFRDKQDYMLVLKAVEEIKVLREKCDNLSTEVSALRKKSTFQSV